MTHDARPHRERYKSRRPHRRQLENCTCIAYIACTSNYCYLYSTHTHAPDSSSSGVIARCALGSTDRARADSSHRYPPLWSATQTRATYDLWWSVWNACLRTSRGMWCLRHAGALAWRRGPVCACTRVCWCRRIFTYTHTYPPPKERPEAYSCRSSSSGPP